MRWNCTSGLPAVAASLFPPEGDEPDAPSRQSLRSHARLEQMLRYMEEHYREKLTLADIAASASIRQKRGHALLQRRAAGLSHGLPSTSTRLSRARDLLLETNDPVTEIALSAGFESCSYLTGSSCANTASPPGPCGVTGRIAVSEKNNHFMQQFTRFFDTLYTEPQLCGDERSDICPLHGQTDFW